MDPMALQQMTDRVARLMEQRLGAKGHGLQAKLRARSRALPRKVRRAVAVLAEAEALAAAPKIARQLDPARVQKAHDIAVHHLQPLGAADRLRATVLGIAASVVLALLVTGAGVLAVMVWRGLI
ncbi:hypothetical protein [Phaeovulum sp. NW3]|uniref:hypothetical protein n=1 Tax=Phaeovulum sp. NW3 TaxID=2934933 RepID=UPI0020214AD4|nr:hypothetical protein [Phaeovulum sp. NW3]MCL7464491.1 hypothetical protein [Phaeovulum sp. NW3]